MKYETKEFRDKTIKNYVIKDDKIIVFYINGYYDFIEKSDQKISDLNFVMEQQLKSFLKEEDEIQKLYNRLDKKINTTSSAIKLALFGDIKEITNILECKKILSQKLEYLKICRAYLEHIDELNSRIGNFPIITVNDIDKYNEKNIIFIANQKRKK